MGAIWLCLAPDLNRSSTLLRNSFHSAHHLALHQRQSRHVVGIFLQKLHADISAEAFEEESEKGRKKKQE